MFQTLIESPANTMDCQQPQQQQQRAAARPRATRVRRTRQAKNPQLSVARRNERERNRVKMVNNGFALLRDRLPVEYLQQSGGGQSGYESAASDSTPADLKSNAAASKSSQAKKFSKVETMRAAIEHNRMLERLMRSVEPEFESVCQLQRDQAPASCGSVSLASSSSSQLVGATQLAASVPGQFVKLEPQHHQQQHQPMEQQQQQQLEQTFEPNEPQQLHTHLWLEQHQESFIEQQRDWYQQQQQLQHTDADHQTQLHHIQPHDLNQNQNQNQWLYLDHNQQQQQQQQQSTFQQLQQPNYTTDQHQSHLMHLNLNHHHHQFQPQHQQFAQHQISLYSQ